MADTDGEPWPLSLVDELPMCPATDDDGHQCTLWPGHRPSPVSGGVHQNARHNFDDPQADERVRRYYDLDRYGEASA